MEAILFPLYPVKIASNISPTDRCPSRYGSVPPSSTAWKSQPCISPSSPIMIGKIHINIIFAEIYQIAIFLRISAVHRLSRHPGGNAGASLKESDLSQIFSQ